MNENNKKQKEAIDTMKDFFMTMKKAAKEKKAMPIKKNEDDLNLSFSQETCPHELCDGSGYTTKIKEGRELSIRCQCYLDFVMNRKLKKSNIPINFYDVTLENLKEIDNLKKSDNIVGSINLKHLKPKLKQGERKIDKRKKEQDPEHPNDFIKRTYDDKEIDKGVFYFANNYSQKVLSLLKENPKKQTLNLMLMGDPGKGKTYMSCAIAKEFLKHNKTVHFTSLRALLDESFDNKAKVRHLVKTKDLLIIDELGQEYHTDSGYALKLIQYIFKERQETRLPIIVTTNSYPNELEKYYEGSLMSTFHGRFLMMVMHGDIDLRILEANNNFEDLDFLN